MKYWPIYSSIVVFVLHSCTAPYNEELPPYDEEIVVEAYVNQAIPSLNYVLLSLSVEYYDDNLDLPLVPDADITLTEGVVEGADTQWMENESIKMISLADLPIPSPIGELPGYYVPNQLGWVAKEGRVYKLEIEVNEQRLSAVTSVPKVVPIDTCYVLNRFNSKADSMEPFEFLAFNDPEGFGNNYRIYRYDKGFIDNPPTWGSASVLLTVDDEFFDAESFTYQSFFPVSYGDTVTFYLNSVDRISYRFWESYDISQNNGGPFTQPINVKGNVKGGRGVFCGMAVDRRRIIIEK